jgi:hypothetical protein
MELHEDPSSGTLICQVVEIEHKHGWTIEDMSWLSPCKEPVVTTIILDDTSTAKRAAQHCAREKDAKVSLGVWMWWTDGTLSDDGRVGSVVVRKQGNEWKTARRDLGTGCMEVFDAELWVIGLTLGETIMSRE